MRWKRSSNGAPILCWIGLAIIVPATGNCAEELDPAKIPLNLLNSWASGKMEWQEMADRATGKIKPEPKKTEPKKTQTPEKSDPKQAKKPEKKPSWTPRPGQRRREPKVCNTMRGLFGMAYSFDFPKVQGDEPKAYDFYRRFDRYDQAYVTAVSLYSHPKHDRYRKHQRYGDLERKVWEAAMLTKSSVSFSKIEPIVTEYSKKLATYHRIRAAQDENWAIGHYKKSEDYRKKRVEYYKTDAKNLKTILKDLEKKGDGDAESLWQLCLRYGDGRPFSPVAYTIMLYRLRDWHPDHPQVKSGEVQWRIVSNLDRWTDAARRASTCPKHKHNHWRTFYEIVGNEAETLIKKWPKNYHTTYGNALWYLAEARRKQGYETTYSQSKAVWKTALEKTKEFQRTKPKHSRNHKHPQTNLSDAMRRVGELNRMIR